MVSAVVMRNRGYARASLWNGISTDSTSDRAAPTTRVARMAGGRLNHKKLGWLVDDLPLRLVEGAAFVARRRFQRPHDGVRARRRRWRVGLLGSAELIGIGDDGSVTFADGKRAGTIR